MISESTIQAARSAADIKQVVEEHVTLKRAGSNYKACCPFHAEKSPSFHVHPAKGIYKCFGCGEGGDAVKFLMRRGMSFPDAILHICKLAGIQPEYTEHKEADVTHELRQRVQATLSAVQAHFVADDNSAGRKYWTGRGYTPETLDMYGVGYCPETGVPLVTAEALQEAGIANEKGNLSFYKRTTIPIHDSRGNLITMVGRSLDPANTGGDKYLNGRNVPGVYEKGRELFNLHRADRHIRATNEVWIVEGYADSMALTQLGKPNNIAVCGVAITDEHVKVLKRYNGDRPIRFIWAGDNQDSREVNAAKWAAVSRLLTIGEVRIAIYPTGCKDAGDILTQGRRLDLVKTEDAIENYVLLHWTKEFSENGSPIEKAERQQEIAELIGKVGKENARDIYINSLAGQIETSPKKLEEMVKNRRAESVVKPVYNVQEPPYIKVGDDYFERMIRPDQTTGSHAIIYKTRKRAELVIEMGAKFIKDIPRFNNWITEPEHVNYRRSITYYVQDRGEKFRFFNRYHPLPAQPKEFPLPEGFIRDPEGYDYEQIPEIRYTAGFLKHIFDHDHYRNQFLNIGWDWLALCYLRPRQRLPALALVSQDEGTGKSTFINLLVKVFGQNATTTDANRIGANFNSIMSGKIFIGVEETKDERGGIENKLKDLITGFRMTVERKFQDAEEEDFFAKFCFASNHEDSFMKVGTQTTRFFVMKVHQVKTKAPDFEERLYREIPYLLYFLQKRGVLYNNGEARDRLFFAPADYENEALDRLRQSSKDIVQQNMEELFNLLWIRTEITMPLIRLDSGYLKNLMIAYAGKMYEQKTPNYFLKVATTDMRMIYRDKPTTYEMVHLSGIHNVDFLTAGRWEYENRKSKGRYIEFPIWRYCTPDEIAENYAPERVQKLVEAISGQMEYIERHYPDANLQEWIAEIQSRLPEPEPIFEQEKLPF